MPSILTFTPSGSSDVTGYKLFHEVAPAEIGPESPSVFLDNPPVSQNGMIEVDLATVPGFSTMDGVYNLGLASVDDVGNESSIVTAGLSGIPLDFVAPDPPTNASVLQS